MSESVRMSHLQKKIIRSEADFDALADAWRGLEVQVADLLPFQTYDWNRVWWTSFAQRTGWRKDELLICALFSGQDLVAVLPLTNAYVGTHHFHLYRYVRPFGADPNLTELRLPLCLPAYRERVLQCWEEISREELFGLTEFQLVQDAHSARHFLQTHHALHALTSREIPNFVLHLGTDWDSFKSQLKRNIKESLRRCYNSLKRDQLEPEFCVLQGREQILPLLPLFYQLHGMRAAASDTVQHPDYFAAPRHRALLEALLDSPFSERCLLLALKLNGKIVALRLAFRMEQQVYLYYSGYDLNYGQYSVMTTLVAETIQWAIRCGIPAINLSVGEDVSKTRWGPEQVDYLEFHCVKNTRWRRLIAEQIYSLKQWRKKRQNKLALQSLTITG
ncbi:MAG: GNAT family N-acetyltransferase [Undibacterium curvum]|uniref:GNAT family N-acetyltransferase n=1 Tax=Undibacterium curvum TaxID=2762294 RepID=UPI003BDA5BDF